jgi:hypothetical protein
VQGKSIVNDDIFFNDSNEKDDPANSRALRTNYRRVNSIRSCDRCPMTP